MGMSWGARERERPARRGPRDRERSWEATTAESGASSSSSSEAVEVEEGGDGARERERAPGVERGVGNMFWGAARAGELRTEGGAGERPRAMLRGGAKAGDPRRAGPSESESVLLLDEGAPRGVNRPRERDLGRATGAATSTGTILAPVGSTPVSRARRLNFAAAGAGEADAGSGSRAHPLRPRRSSSRSRPLSLPFADCLIAPRASRTSDGFKNSSLW
ncbi:hypothetical protein BDK51DRAFT_25895 [Blyttiomyces helicus]|uniref:Uncharacterized protein n=1 Tax=Blyttiomyces helicus TaxID=388810 RepID=A0A4P9W9U2_9FUNG|nr:hypothetical protein BDK51DRAFT_25895 [Blyttiomyces helicus]|eukprot:RKO88962.1 hypothetical protein BDK51DRAFT_25895 [Blyttiomyces helicus]